MTSDDFEAWVEQHCAATAANADAAAALLANYRVFAFSWHATRTELSECTIRLVTKRRVPKFGNEHTDAIGNELHHLRLEGESERTPDASQAFVIGSEPEPVACRYCDDTGFVTVPLWRCVEVPHNDPPRLVFHPGYRSVLTGSVLCDRPSCEPGRRVRDRERNSSRPRPVLGKYLQRFGGVNVVAVLREHESEQAEHARRTGGPNPFAAVIQSIKSRIGRAGP